MSTDPKTLLKEHKLRLTDCRLDVLNAFLTTGHALSHADIEHAMTEQQYDRVTIYRTLNSFMDNGLLHKVPVDDGSMRYALCSDDCDDHGHDDDHIHFKCVQCGKTQCLEDMPLPKLKLPDGFTVNDVNFLVQGVCKNCNAA